jgi:cysteine desulfurase family protein (TIGR01976 family)
MTSALLDLDFVRSRFPALGDDWALFDNAGGSAPLGDVIERVRDHMSRRPVQLGATYRHSVEAQAAVDSGRAAMARLIGADPGEIVLGASSTALVRLLARALRPRLSPGDEVVVTNADHEANIGAWRELAADGIVVREWRLDPEVLELTAAGLDALLGPRTRLVCFTHCSNLVGTLHDVPALVRRIHDAGALACIDGVAYAPHRRIDVRALGADFYFFSLYKVYGPHLGLLYGRRDLLLAAKGQNHFFVGEDEVPYKLEPGGVNHELTASLPAILEYLLELGDRAGAAGIAEPDAVRLDAAFGAIARHEAALAAPLLAFLGARPGVRIVGRPDADPARRVPTVSFVVEGRDSCTVPPRLDAQRIAIRWGHFYAHRLVEALDLLPQNGVVRVSMAHYNTPAEVERLIAALDRTL